MDARSATAVRDALRRQSRSLLQYLSEARPWAPAAGGPALAKLEALAAEDRRALTVLVRLLQRKRLELPYLGPFAAEFTNINDVSLDSVWPVLAEGGRRSVRILEAERQIVSDADARAALGQLLEVKRRHAEVFAGMATGARATAPAGP